MKFRVLFIIFNVVILASFALIFLMPAFVLGWDYTSVFWSTNWPVAAVFLVVLLGLNAYFLYNWRIFTLLEGERWHDLIDYLEREAFEKKRLSRQRARILVNAYVVTGAVDRIRELERFIRDEKPNLLPKLAVELGLPHLLSNQGEQMAAYFGEMKERPDVADPLWIRWCYAFALMTRSDFEAAGAELTVVLDETKDPLLRMLTAHMLEPFGARNEETANRVREAREELHRRYSRDRINKELEHQRQNLQVLFLSSRIEEARDWVFTS